MKLPAIEHKGHALLACPLTKQKGSTLSSQEEQNVRYLLDINPKVALKEIDNLFAQSTHPVIFSLKTHLAIQCRKIKLADRLIVENFQFNPQSINAFINYADLLVRKKKKRALETLLKGVYDLPELFPNVRAFYIDDARAFYTLMGHYFISEPKRATLYYSNAYKLAPDHPATVRLERLLLAAEKKRLRWYR